jgi:hypothetical protein
MSAKRRRRGTIAPLATLLRELLARAAWTAYADRAALYVVQLTDPHGFALALRVHAKLAGPDPAVLRERAQGEAIARPHMTGSAPVELLARILEGLDPESGEGALRAWTMRAMFEGGAVPVVLVEDGATVVTTLAAIEEPEGSAAAELGSGGWTRPVIGEA